MSILPPVYRHLLDPLIKVARDILELGQSLRHSNDWLVLDFADLRDRAANMSVDQEEALQVDLREQPGHRPYEYDRSFGWWEPPADERKRVIS